MDEEEDRKRVAEYRIGEDTDQLSIEELHERISAYEGEIARLRQIIGDKERVRTDAEQIFGN